jgi:hypothetical protein
MNSFELCKMFKNSLRVASITEMLIFDEARG